MLETGAAGQPFASLVTSDFPAGPSGGGRGGAAAPAHPLGLFASS